MNYRRLFIPNTYVFLTVVTYNRKQILIDNITILRNAFEETKRYFKFEIFGVSIMPDHFHILIKPQDISEYPKIIKSIKYNFSNKLDIVGLASPTYVAKREKIIWQRRYHEHTIRDEDDLYKHLDYIHYNPVKHGFVNCVKDWEYSSFEKFVKLKNYDKNWGSCNDIERIQDLDYD